MISDERLAEIEAAISRVAEAAHSDSLPNCCAGCVAELALADLLAALRAERERAAALEELVQTLSEEAAEAYQQVDALAAALTPDSEQP